MMITNYDQWCLIYLIFICGLQVFSKALTPEDAKGYTNCTMVKIRSKNETNRNLGNYFSFKKMPMCQFLLLLNRKDFSPS